MKITKDAIEEFKNSIIVEPNATPTAILGGVIYLLYLSSIRVSWRELKKRFECLVRGNLQNPIYSCFKDIAHLDSYFEDYFTGRPSRQGWDLSGRVFFESKGWCDFRRFIEDGYSIYSSDVKIVVKIANDLVKNL